MDTHPLSFLRQVKDDLHLAQKIPLWGSPPNFPWEEFSKALQKDLEIAEFTLHAEKKALLSPKEFLVSFGKRPIIKTLELAPLSGTVHFILSQESLESITALLLASEETSYKFSDTDLQEGFYEYLLLCASKTFSEISPYPDFQLQWLEEKELPHTSSFCSDVALSIKGRTFPSRLLFSPAFHKGFSDHFEHSVKDPFSSSLTETLSTELKVIAGSCMLPKKDWDRLKIGDFLVLDTCSYDPLLRKGTLTLSLEKTPLFKVKLKKGKLKILDYCTYYGDANTMDEDTDDLNPFFSEEEPLDELEEESTFDSLEDAPEEEKELVKEEKLVSSLEIPFPIVVEIDRIHMPLKKLLSLEPGNILELPMHPEQGVYLTVHGKKIAKGELIKLGDAIGVKIVELGEP